jgi:hypothetical protein
MQRFLFGACIIRLSLLLPEFVKEHVVMCNFCISQSTMVPLLIRTEICNINHWHHLCGSKLLPFLYIASVLFVLMTFFYCWKRDKKKALDKQLDFLLGQRLGFDC